MPLRKLILGLSDHSGEVTGTAVIHHSRCTPGATLADADNTITLTLTGTSTTLFGTYNGVWNGVNNKCGVDYTRHASPGPRVNATKFPASVEITVVLVM